MARSDRTLHVPPALFDDLKELARAESVSVSALVRRELTRVVRERRSVHRPCPVCGAPAASVHVDARYEGGGHSGFALRAVPATAVPYLRCERGHAYGMPQKAGAA